MKELSIEEKAKRYDDILVKLQKAKVDDNVCDDRYCCVIDIIVPELVESEDERIRKQLIEHTKWSYDEQEISEEEKERWISWLEKQAEHKKFRDSIQIGDKVTKNKDGVLVNLSQLKRVAKKDEQILANSAKTYKDKQKFAWSEKDEAMTEIIINDIVAIKERTCCKNVCDEEINWLESLKDRIQPKQEWSEEDKRKINDVIVALSEYANGNIPNIIPSILLERVAWLKSLKDRVQPQNRWKPSELQLECLSDAIEHYYTLNYPATKLVELLEQLKKL